MFGRLPAGVLGVRDEPVDDIGELSDVVSSTTAPSAARSGAWARVLSRRRDRLFGEDGAGVDAELGRPPARALLRIGGQEDLHLGVRGDDRADVAAFGDPVAVGEQTALLGDDRGRGHRGRRPPARRPPRPRAADRVGDVAPVEQDPLAERDRELGAIPAGSAPAGRRERDTPVHRAGIEVGEAQPLRDGTRDGRFPAPSTRDPVGRDRHSSAALTRRAREGAILRRELRVEATAALRRHSSKNVGHVLETTPGSSSTIGTRVPISENAIAMRWSL